MTRTEMIESRLREAFDPASLEVIDQSHLHAGHAGAKSGGGHFDIIIVADKLEGMSQVARHRMIYDALGDMMPAQIHALSIKAYAPNEI
jgi:BolA protein